MVRGIPVGQRCGSSGSAGSGRKGGKAATPVAATEQLSVALDAGDDGAVRAALPAAEAALSRLRYPKSDDDAFIAIGLCDRTGDAYMPGHPVVLFLFSLVALFDFPSSEK